MLVYVKIIRSKSNHGTLYLSPIIIIEDKTRPHMISNNLPQVRIQTTLTVFSNTHFRSSKVNVPIIHLFMLL